MGVFMGILGVLAYSMITVRGVGRGVPGVFPLKIFDLKFPCRILLHCL